MPARRFVARSLFRRAPVVLVAALVVVPATAGPAGAAIRPSIRINDATVTEGNTGTVNAVFTVSLSRVPLAPVTVDYATGGGTATAGTDYSPRSGTLTFLTGQQSMQIVVPVIGDITAEQDETFLVTLSNPGAARSAERRGPAPSRMTTSQFQPTSHCRSRPHPRGSWGIRSSIPWR